ncbi:hypothetical protein ONZ43_g5518 [Nemania bipapillata]|uniref:Uncharacterized protein n=1 Tax=Nemania bipapillata TaxID=110536 RepID=A0ACC2I9K1_9PEZI|nr:hypothetical protein ONZ43_g5518 [Nemania bipapillata]
MDCLQNIDPRLLEMDRQFDIDAFVRRGAQERLIKGGRIARPSNGFILYRKAYIAYAREITKVMNCNSLSRIIGASYRVESEEIKAKFKEYSVIEKEQHIHHFPNYTYKPRTRDSYINDEDDIVEGDDDDDNDDESGSEYQN